MLSKYVCKLSNGEYCWEVIVLTFVLVIRLNCCLCMAHFRVGYKIELLPMHTNVSPVLLRM